MDFKSSASKFLQYVNASPSPFHAVHASRTALLAAGFEEISERDNWDIKPLGKYFFTRNQSTLIAFAVGGKYEPGNGFAIVGAHTDSPCLRVKPTSKLDKSGYLSVGLECYGGGLWNTWFDRDLSVAGRVLLRKSDVRGLRWCKVDRRRSNTSCLMAEGAEGGFSHRLVRIDKPILRIPNLAIHLNRNIYSEGFKYNKETNLPAILRLATGMYKLNEPIETDSRDDAPSVKKEKTTAPFSQEGRHHSGLLNILCKQLDCEVKDICDFELCLYDTQPSCFGGPADEFILSPRLDNLESAFCGLEAMVASVEDSASFSSDPTTRLLALFDHEEVGSSSAQGAASSLFEHVLRRISAGKPTGFEEAIPKSYIISSDMAHAVHPNYPDKHEANHKPMMNAGPVIKFNSNQRYATNAITALVLRRIAEIAEVPLQDVMVRNDSACGSTIGPIMSAGLAIRTIDIGNAQLAMHSIREMGGSKDIKYGIDLLKVFYCKFADADSTIQVE
eukprot:gene10020-2194_t